MVEVMVNNCNDGINGMQKEEERELERIRELEERKRVRRKNYFRI